MAVGKSNANVLPAATEEPTPTPEVEIQQNAYYIYPNANILLNTSEEVSLEVDADASGVADWYKSQIRDLGFNTKSFVQSKVNGQLEANFTAANGDQEIKVKINGSESGVTSVEISFE